MPENKYRVVESRWKGGARIEIEISSSWKSERAAKDEMRVFARMRPSITYSIQKENGKVKDGVRK